MKWEKPLDRALGIILWGMFLVVFPGMVSPGTAEVVKGRVTSVQGDGLETDIGSAKGLGIGDVGRIFYTIKIEGKETSIFVGELKITSVSEKSSKAQIQEKRAEIKVGYGVEVTIKVGELKVNSKPPGAIVYLDGKKVGETPVTLSKVKLGRHQIRILKEGYDPYEVREVVGAKRKEVVASLNVRVREGGIAVLSEPAGAAVYIDDRMAGKTPYEGGEFSPKAYKVRVVKDGFEVWEKEVDIEAGRKVEVYAQLKGKEAGLEVRSVPAKARVWLDGREMGETPLNLSLKAGQHLVRVFKDGYEVYEERVQAGGTDRKTVSVSLKRILGDLFIHTDPPGATIYLDGNAVGMSTYEGKGLPPKAYRVRASKEGYENWEREVVVVGGRKVEALPMLRKKEGAGISPPSEKPKEKAARVAEKEKPATEEEWAKKVWGPPVWKTGDKWTYRNVTGETWSIEVINVEGDSFIAKFSGWDVMPAYNKKTMNLDYLITKEGKKRDADTYLEKVLDFPLQVGKKWRNQSPRYTYNSFEIEGVEKVTTPAGSFMAYKIFYRQEKYKPPGTFGVGEGWLRFWYSPEVGMWVKREVEKSAFWEEEKRIQDFQLISYRLK